ncbi:hypothetical protein NPIL_527991 [Nephila pilipes]|uniref:Uncharacterized protein n=1 Tax=Nephila pilipes TaxID=299642 RepID=A0A8X6QQT9_NEPPI|nr:hypothetical protein NPIL_527991 [Nephila pilipes]
MTREQEEFYLEQYPCAYLDFNIGDREIGRMSNRTSRGCNSENKPLGSYKNYYARNMDRSEESDMEPLDLSVKNKFSELNHTTCIPKFDRICGENFHEKFGEQIIIPIAHDGKRISE